ncbi:MAG: hypothetical protein V3U10_01240 [Bacteroidota bacterium]
MWIVEGWVTGRLNEGWRFVRAGVDSARKRAQSLRGRQGRVSRRDRLRAIASGGSPG